MFYRNMSVVISYTIALRLSPLGDIGEHKGLRLPVMLFLHFKLAHAATVCGVSWEVHSVPRLQKKIALLVLIFLQMKRKKVLKSQASW